MHESAQLSVIDNQVDARVLVKVTGLTDAGLLLAGAYTFPNK